MPVRSAPSTSTARRGKAKSCRGDARASERRRLRSEARAASSGPGAACNGLFSPKASFGVAAPLSASGFRAHHGLRGMPRGRHLQRHGVRCLRALSQVSKVANTRQ